MTAIYKGVALREHRDRTRVLKREAADGYTEATGVTDTVKYSGRWTDVLAKAAEIAGAAADTVEAVCTCTRVAADMGELSVVYTEYRVPEGGGGGEGSAAVGTAENPQYTFSTSDVAEPLMCHPYFRDTLNEDDKWILQQLAGGAHPDSIQEYGNLKGTLRDLCAQLSGPAAELRDFYLEGVTQYLEVYAEATARWKGSAGSWVPMTICEPPGPVHTPEGRDWLCVGVGVEESGGEVWHTAKFKLSGAGGWNKKLYGQS